MASEELENLAFRLLPPLLLRQKFPKESLNADEQRNSSSFETKVYPPPFHEFKYVCAKANHEVRGGEQPAVNVRSVENCGKGMEI